jgi:hypothetical protein
MAVWGLFCGRVQQSGSKKAVEWSIGRKKAPTWPEIGHFENIRVSESEAEIWAI